MHSPDDASLCEMKCSLYCTNFMVNKFHKDTQFKHWDSHSFPVLPKHEKFGLQFWSGLHLRLSFKNRIMKSRNQLSKERGNLSE